MLLVRVTVRLLRSVPLSSEAVGKQRDLVIVPLQLNPMTMTSAELVHAALDVLYVFSKSEDTGKVVCKEGGFDALTQYLVDMKPAAFALETDAIELTCAALWNLLQVGLPGRTSDAARQKDQWQHAVARVNENRVQRIAKAVGCRLLLAVVKALSMRDSLVTNLCRIIAVRSRGAK